MEPSFSSQPTRPTPSLSRRRDKPQLSCTLCRKRKLKCDRRQPCETCARRGLSCTYVQSNPPQRLRPSQLLRPPPASKMQDRISHLEELVVSLMNAVNTNKTSNQVPSKASAMTESLSTTEQNSLNGALLPQSAPRLTDSFGRISLENAATSYVEEPHWTAILDNIAELKDYFEDRNDVGERDTISAAPPDPYQTDLLFGGYQPATREVLLAALPLRPIVDKLVREALDVRDMTTVIHRPTFLKEYDQFWNNPQETSIMWIGLLFGIMCLGLHFRRVPSTSNSENLAILPSDAVNLHIYREKHIQCLVLGNYQKCAPYTIEALLVLLRTECLRSDDSQCGIWVLVGIVVRIALRMGYHRDPSQSPRISPFQGEMRRRTWLLIFWSDLVASIQFGLPITTQQSHFDVREPRNLLDEDFDESITELPPSRSDSEETPVQFLTLKHRLMCMYITSCIISTSISPSSYPEVMKHDRILQETYMTIPADLQMRSMEESAFESGETIIKRIYLALTFRGAQCILHRKYLVLARTDPKFTYSRTSCITAALVILDYQRVLQKETQVDRQLFQDRWRVSSVIKQIFLLATTILCLDLDQTMSQTPPSNDLLDLEFRGKELKALYASYMIWRDASDVSREARKAAEVLRIILGKAQQNGIGTLDGFAIPGTNVEGVGTSFFNPSPEQSFSAMEDPDPINGMPLFPEDIYSLIPPESDSHNSLFDFQGADLNSCEEQSWEPGYGTLTHEQLMATLKSTTHPIWVNRNWP